MLRNLTIIDIAQKEIKKRTGKDIPLWDESILNDKKALNMIASGDTDGVFQLESDGMKKFMRQLQPDCFEDIIAGVALYRPGPMDYIPDYIQNKHNPNDIKYITPELESILAPTYGIIVYQEQVMLIVQNWPVSQWVVPMLYVKQWEKEAGNHGPGRPAFHQWR